MLKLGRYWPWKTVSKHFHMPGRPMLLHRMALVSFRLLCKNLGNLHEFFGQMVYRPPWPKIARTPKLYNREKAGTNYFFLIPLECTRCLSLMSVKSRWGGENSLFDKSGSHKMFYLTSTGKRAVRKQNVQFFSYPSENTSRQSDIHSPPLS